MAKGPSRRYVSQESERVFPSMGWSYFDPGRFRAPEVPHLSIETTNICNAACVFCANPVMERRKQPLSMEEFKLVVDELVRIGGNRLDFNATIGEPTLDPHLLERARYVQRYPQMNPIGFVSTLQWLHRHRMEDFFSAGISWISASCTLSGREQYAAFFGVDLYDQMLTNLIALLEANGARGGPVSVYVAQADERATGSGYPPSRFSSCGKSAQL